MFIGFGTCVVDTSCLKEVDQSVGIMSYEAEVTSSNPPSTSCVDISKKKKKFDTSCEYYTFFITDVVAPSTSIFLLIIIFF
jgi:hypothetical protein